MSRGIRAMAGVVLAAVALTSCGTAAAGQSVPSSPSPPSVSPSPATSMSMSPSPSPSPSPTATFPVAALSRILRQYVKMFGGSEVTVARGVSTNRAAALRLATPGDDDGQDPDVPVYLLQAVGKFTGGGMEPVPSGAKQIGGTQLMLVVNAGGMTVTDFGISTGRANIAPLGTAFELAVTR